MTKASLLSTVAASLLLTAGTASAQMQQKMPERAPPAQQSAPAEKVAPPMNAGEHKAVETTGQDVKSLAPGRGGSATTGQETKGSDKVDAQGGAKADVRASDKDGKASDKADVKAESAKGAAGAESKTKADAKGRAGAKSDTNESADIKSKSDSSRSTAAEKSTDSAKEKSATSGQGAAAGSAKLSTEQRTKITTIIRQKKVERVSPAKLNISIRIGQRVPTRVHFHPVPVEVVEVYPEWRGYLFILVGDQIVIISPDDHEIVAVLNV